MPDPTLTGQKSTATYRGRHRALFDQLGRELIAVPAPKILSFGCSRGAELLDLARIDGARVYGCDVNPAALVAARQVGIEHGFDTFPSTPAGIAARGPYDAIVAMSVLCRFPTPDPDDLSAEFPFAQFERLLEPLVGALRPGGLLLVHNAQYLVGDAACAADLEPVATGGAGNGWLEKYGRDSRRITTVEAEWEGRLLPLREWRGAIRRSAPGLTADALAPEEAARIELLGYRHVPIPAAEPLDLQTVLWRRREWPRGRLGAALSQRDRLTRELRQARAERRVIARKGAAEGELARALGRGEPLADAVTGAVRALLAERETGRARALAHGLLRDEATAGAGHLGAALVALAGEHPALAAHHLGAAPAALRARLLPAETLEVAYARGGADAGRAALDEVLAAGHPPPLRLRLAEIAFAAGDLGSARTLLGTLGELRGDQAARRDWLARWLEPPGAGRAETAVAAVPAVPAVAILDYDQPDRARRTTNLGDYVQTLAVLGQIARLAGVTWQGDPDLVALLGELGAPDPVELAPAVTATLTVVDRDWSRQTSAAAGTWVLAYGWHMHAPFGGGYDFPYHPGLRPLYLSFHVNRRELLTDAAIAHLRDHGPIGCRDWATVDLLRGVGVEAFFSGCITTTIADPLGRVDPAADRSELPLLRVDLAGETGEAHTQIDPAVGRADLGANLRRARAWLQQCRDGAGAIATSRLHCYLPSVAMGLDVSFQPRNLADVRFDGLSGLQAGDAALEQMRSRLRERTAAIVAEIVSGAERDAVYARWRELWADALAEAEERARRELPPPATGPVDAACAAIRAAAVRHGDPVPGAVNVALAYDAAHREHAHVMIASLLAHASRPVNLSLLTRELEPSEAAIVGAAHPEAAITQLRCDAVSHAETGLDQRISVSTLDRLLLADLLPEVDRIVYLDTDVLVLGDIAELFDADLGGRPLMARTPEMADFGSGYAHLHRAAMRLDAPRAHELRHRLARRHAYDFAAFNAGVMVLDLAALRARGLLADALGLSLRYDLNDQEALMLAAGPDFAPMPAAWNLWPLQDPVAGALILHWAGTAKPWDEAYVLGAEHWREWQARTVSREDDA